MLTHEQQSILRQMWLETRARLLYRLLANRFTPLTKALAFIEEQTSYDRMPNLWGYQYCRAIGSTPQMLINGECTARLDRDEILVRQIQQELNGIGMEEAALEQSRDFGHLARVLREQYIED